MGVAVILALLRESLSVAVVSCHDRGSGLSLALLSEVRHLDDLLRKLDGLKG